MSQEFTTYRSVFDKGEYIKQGYIITYDNLDSVDDLPELSTLERQDIYHARTGDLSSDYIVPVDTDESGSFDEWRSLVDGERIIAISDLGLDHFYYSQELESTDTWPDEDGDLDASAVGSPTLNSSGINGYQTVDYADIGDRHETASNWGLGENNVWTAVAVAQLDSLSSNQQRIGYSDSDGNGGYRFGEQNGNWDVINFGGGGIETASADTEPHVHVLTYDGSNVIWDIDGTEIYNTSLSGPADPTGYSAFGGQPGFDDGSLNGTLGAFGHENAASDASRRDDLTQKLGDAFDITVSV